MAISAKNYVGQTMPLYTIGHIQTRLRGALGSKTTFIVVEGNDDIAFYERFFDKTASAMYPSEKLDGDGNVIPGGCEETMHVVSTILNEGKTQKIIGIIDTDYRRFEKNWKYPKAIFHTDRKDMEMTVLAHPNVRAALRAWNKNIDGVISIIEPVVKHMGMLRICNDVLSLGCRMNKVKIHNAIDEQHGNVIKSDWKCVLTKRFLSQCYKQTGIAGWSKAIIGLLQIQNMHIQNYDMYDIGQGHDTLHMMHYLLNNNRYTWRQIWQEMQKAYSINEFHSSNLYQTLRQWQIQIGVNILR